MTKYNKGSAKVITATIAALILVAGISFYAGTWFSYKSMVSSAKGFETPAPAVNNMLDKTNANSAAGANSNTSTKTNDKTDKTGTSEYVGSKYAFSYSSNWTVFEVNNVTGSTIVYPNSRSQELMNKSIPYTAQIHISITTPAKPLDLSNSKSVVIDGITWYINNYGVVDGGNENGIEYIRVYNANSYVTIFTGVSNKAVLEIILSSFRAG